MSISKKFSTAAAMTVVAIGAATASPASAATTISRSQCGAGYLQLYSSATTCWANAGEVYVQLYGVNKISSGDNAGWVQRSNGTRIYFKKGTIQSFSSTTITIVHIN